MKTLTSLQRLRRRLRRQVRRKAGFTLLEILIVLAIIGLLITVVGAGLMQQLDNAKVRTAQISIKGFKTSLDTMNLAIGRYPTASEGLDLLVKDPGDAAPGWNGPYLNSDAVPMDPWGHPYVYVAPEGGDAPKVKSLGNDGKEGGAKNAADIEL